MFICCKTTIKTGSEMSMADIYLITGSNQGDRFAILNAAKMALSERVGNIISETAIYETAPWGKTDQPSFLNQVLHLQTALMPAELLNVCLGIEKEHGRRRKQQWEARTLDIDILFYNQEVIIEEGLIVPHPHLHERRFVLEPLNALIPNWVHPVLNLSVRQLLALCHDKLPVHIFTPPDNGSAS
jgi:2-amino-4-hydroxy-6-hydroxymethyldihydropteridine diphosphokinase